MPTDKHVNRIPDLERFDLEAEIARVEGELEAKIDALSPEQRTLGVQRTKQAFAAKGEALTSEDEEILALFCEGVLDSRHVMGHFGDRLLFNYFIQSGE
jgi:hypothetical protein